MTAFPAPTQGIVLAHFIVSDDIERSRRFYTEVLGGETVTVGEPSYVALANSWIIINVGGGPTDDKPTVILETPRDPDRVNSFLNIRVADIEAVYEEWSAARGRVPDATEAARDRDPLLHPGPGRLSDRGRPDHPCSQGADRFLTDRKRATHDRATAGRDRHGRVAGHRGRCRDCVPSGRVRRRRHLAFDPTVRRLRLPHGPGGPRRGRRRRRTSWTRRSIASDGSTA